MERKFGGNYSTPGDKLEEVKGVSPTKLNTTAEEFVENLLNEGGKVPCDDTSVAFKNNFHLPPYYDEELFKKGQEFFHRNLFAMIFSKFLGLIALLTLPSVHLLAMTNMSSTTYTAYKRYTATVFHMCLWYYEEFKPGSCSWNSISVVRNLHNSASKKGSICLKYRINQKDMALTQFGFIGLALVRGELVGVHSATDEELKSFIHLWRTIGYVLGIEERFNICRESVKETKEICNLLIEKVFKQSLRNPPTPFEKMARALTSGMWVNNPVVTYDVFLLYLKMTLENNNDVVAEPDFKKLYFGDQIKILLISFVLWSLQFTVIRVMHNNIEIFALWCMRHFPFFAYWKFGKAKSNVTI